MDYNETLAALLGMMGKNVVVRITPDVAGAPPVLVAMEGTLDCAPDHTENTTDEIKERLGEARFFQLDNERFGFYLSPSVFKDAQWDPFETVLTVRQAGAEILVSPDE